MQDSDYSLEAVRLGIDSHQQAVAFMPRSCHICRSEGFNALSRVLLRGAHGEVVALLNIVDGDWLPAGQIGLSEAAWTHLQAQPGERLRVLHAPPIDSLSHVRGKLYGHTLDAAALTSIIEDIAHGRYSDVQLTAFVAACAGDHLNRDEIRYLTSAMVDVGQRLSWGSEQVFDKHCVGGLPGNRTTPIVVAIIAAHDLRIPKTSSRAITSPAGTADTMATLTIVDLDIAAMRRVVEKENGCLVWGGSVNLSPADDILIRVERALELDSEGQLIASVLSKKIAAGSTHVLIDIPVGATAKLRTQAAALQLKAALDDVGSALGLHTRVLLSDGTQAVGRGIGPALEARDVLAVLNNAQDAAKDLRERALTLAAVLLEMAGKAAPRRGYTMAQQSLDSGAAFKKFQAICEAQGGWFEPPVAAHQRPVLADKQGLVAAIDNRVLARIAKLAGAPNAPAAGVALDVTLGTRVERGQTLFTVHAQTPGELDYALAYYRAHGDFLHIEPESI